MAQAVVFLNWTDQDFTWTWNKVEYTFPAGREMMLEGYLANHFAKHLTDRELLRMDKPTDHFSRADLIRKCFSQQTLSAPDAASLATKLMNPEPENKDLNTNLPEKKTQFCDLCDSKGVRHKKECPKYEATIQKPSTGLTS